MYIRHDIVVVFTVNIAAADVPEGDQLLLLSVCELCPAAANALTLLSPRAVTNTVGHTHTVRRLRYRLSVNSRASIYT